MECQFLWSPRETTSGLCRGTFQSLECIEVSMTSLWDGASKSCFSRTYLITWMDVFRDWGSLVRALENGPQRQESAVDRANTL